MAVCDPFEYAPNVTRRYLHDALDLDCDSDEYAATQSVALIAIAIWPLGVPLVYALLLWLSRDAILNDRPTALSRATAFLWDAYKPVSARVASKTGMNTALTSALAAPIGGSRPFGGSQFRCAASWR